MSQSCWHRGFREANGLPGAFVFLHCPSAAHGKNHETLSEDEREGAGAETDTSWKFEDLWQSPTGDVSPASNFRSACSCSSSRGSVYHRVRVKIHGGDRPSAATRAGRNKPHPTGTAAFIP